MVPVEERAVLAGLEARRAAVLHELSRVDTQIRETEQAQARLVERIRTLEQKPRQAA
jgi:hypothetical protein